MQGWLVFITFVATLSLIYGLLALSLNLQYGYAGLLNFGVVAFFAAGAFTSALVTLAPPGSPNYEGNYEIGFGMPFVVGLVAAGAVGGLLALLIGSICVRLRGDYLAIATFSLAQIFVIFLSNEDWLTRGQFGISSVPQPLKGSVVPSNLFSFAYFGVTVVVVGSAYWLTRRVTSSPFGRTLRGIREDEEAARSLGKNASAFKLKTFVAGGVLAGLAGSLWAHFIGGVHVGQFVPIITFQVWLAMLLGGVGNNIGVMFGAVLLTIIREGTRFLSAVPALERFETSNPTFLPSLRFVIIGLLLIIVVRIAPRGVLPERLRKHTVPEAQESP